jgi:hypothetical protein
MILATFTRGRSPRSRRTRRAAVRAALLCQSASRRHPQNPLKIGRSAIQAGAAQAPHTDEKPGTRAIALATIEIIEDERLVEN